MMDEDELDDQYEAFQSIADRSTPEKAVQRLRLLRVPDDIIEMIRQRHEAEVIKIREMREPNVVYQSGRLTWYTGPRSDDRFWPALKNKLRSGPRPWSDDAIEILDEESTKVVGLLDHPGSEDFRSMGLALGYVQSGKTANFTAVMAKAADRGYRLFIVLSGIHNALRRQTQARLAGELVRLNPAQWHEVTTVDSDFHPKGNAAAYFSAKNQRVLLVVKKNAKVLEKLNDWLSSAREYLRDCPTLVIDDEADQATVGGKVINPLMSKLLKSFTKVDYIGYTATPFANLLIDPAVKEDFYPRDFIVRLKAPEGYQGPALLFGRDPLDGEDPNEVPGGEDMIREIPDEEVEFVRPINRAAAVDFMPTMTPSLRQAVLYFWLATAARHERATGIPHSTMLVHTTLQTGIHEDFRAPLEGLRQEVLLALRSDDHDLYMDLETQWADERSRVEAADFGQESVPFDAVLRHLPAVLERSRVVVDNFRSRDRLDYESGPVVAIAVGGNTLSRGLTLEGLVTSYFVRASSAYDTLLQMGRWFGHRAGYGDLPRIWMTAELAGWFRHLAVVEAEIRKDIDRYLTEDKNPLTFAVRIRTHPKMLVTAPARMKTAVTAHAAYGGDLVESRYFRTGRDDSDWLRQNADAGFRLVQAAQQHGRPEKLDASDRRLWRDVTYRDVIRFLGEYQFDERSEEARPPLLKRYIEKRVEQNSLLNWDVAVFGSSSKEAPSWKLPDGTKIGMIRRSRINGVEDALADIKTLSGPRDAAINLAVPDGIDVTKRSEVDKLRRAQRPEHGLLLLYPIDPISESSAKRGRHPLNAPYDVVLGAAFVFPTPATSRDSEVEHDYVSADLSRVEGGRYWEEEDPEILKQELEDDAP
ncbi:Z1 domain-containing protein [Actinoplanes regularis]|uniref:Z1 domain-containing protein n=1 Tax=Actinoplanes regularis TaxID=52697 RepID=A0A239AU05_9ACTN|nr:Z1 domain-containing protein [Actinoplanes regularis]GIE87358.1 endonuclease [Actinoplanes regularis]SNR99175.1 Z1 domain-containing protein [Actinoplanes regularis]